MRACFFTLATLLLTTLLMTGCSKQWANPDIPNKQQAAAQFERDSVSCEVMAGNQYPLDKDKQNEVYDTCMTEKGWEKKTSSNVFDNTRY